MRTVSRVHRYSLSTFRFSSFRRGYHHPINFCHLRNFLQHLYALLLWAESIVKRVSCEWRVVVAVMQRGLFVVVDRGGTGDKCEAYVVTPMKAATER